MSDDRDTIRAFLATHLDGALIGDGDDLFATGLVSSLFAVQIVMWVQRTFHLEVSSNDLELDNFRSVEAIVDFVARMRAQQPADMS